PERPSSYLITLAALSGQTKRNSCISRSREVGPWNRASRLCGNVSAATCGTKRSRTDCQKAVRWKSFCHQLHQRLTVRAGTESCCASAPATEPAGGETNISAIATYTRRPRKRTDTGVE